MFLFYNGKKHHKSLKSNSLEKRQLFENQVNIKRQMNKQKYYIIQGPGEGKYCDVCCEHYFQNDV